MNATPTEKLVEAYRFLKANNSAAARVIIKDVIRQFPGSERAWLMMSLAVAEPAHQADCLRRVLSINPNNQEARTRLEQLLAIPAPALVEAAPPAEPEPNWLYQPTAPAGGNGKPMTRPLNGYALNAHWAAPLSGRRSTSATHNRTPGPSAALAAPGSEAPVAPSLAAVEAPTMAVAVLEPSAPAEVAPAPAVALNGTHAAASGEWVAAGAMEELALAPNGGAAHPYLEPPAAPLNRARRKQARARLLRTQSQPVIVPEAPPIEADPRAEAAPPPSGAVALPERPAIGELLEVEAIPLEAAAGVSAPQSSAAVGLPAIGELPKAEAAAGVSASLSGAAVDLPELPATGELPEPVDDPAPADVPSWLLTPTQVNMPAITPRPALEEAPRKAPLARDPDAMLRWLVPALIGTWVAFIVVFVVGFIFFAPR